MLSMTRPSKHPKTGVYRVRKVVPAALRAVVGKRELVASLGTKDPALAKQRAIPVLARFEAVIEAARAPDDQITQREAAALAGIFYRQEYELWRDDPGSPADWDMALQLLGDQLSDYDGPPDPEADANRTVVLSPQDLADADRLLRQHGRLSTPANLHRVALSLVDAKARLFGALGRLAGGDWRPDKTPDTFPPLEPRQAQAVPPKVSSKVLTVSALIDAWAAEAGAKGRKVYDRQSAGRQLTAYLGHDDAARVTVEDAISWKEARLAAGRSVSTVSNDIIELKPIWDWAIRNRKLSGENPFAGIAPRKPKRRSSRARLPFTEEQAAALLLAARADRRPSVRWLPWLACFTGARIGELAQSRKEDIRQEPASGVWFLAIHADSVTGDRTIKTDTSERHVPLHPALLAEGFLTYVQGLSPGSLIAPDLTPDSFNLYGGYASKKLGRWVRNVVGITDRRLDPNHAWRHRFQEQARRVGIRRDVEDALTGHDNPINAGDGYGRGWAFMPEATFEYLAKIPAPLAPAAN